MRRTDAGVALIVVMAAGAAALALADPASLRATFVHDNAPLFYLLLLGWTRVFGASAFALRALPSAAFAGAIVFSALAARHAGSERAAWLTAVLVGCSVPFGLEPAATARPYALAALFAAMSLWAALRVKETTSAANAAAPILASHLFGLFTHPVFVFVSVASAIAGVVTRRGRVVLAAAPAAALAIYGAMWWPVLTETAALPARTWMMAPRAADLLSGMQFWGDHGTPVLAALAALVLLAVRYAGSARVDMRGAAFALLIVVLVLGGAFLASRITPVYVAERTPIFVLPAASVVFGVAIAELSPAWVTAAAALMVIVSAVRFTVRTHDAPDPFPTRASLAVVALKATCGDTIVAAGLSYAPVLFYAPSARMPACVRLVAFPEDVREHPGWLDLSPDAITALPGTAAAAVARLPSSGTVWVFTQTRGVGAPHSFALLQALSATRPAAAKLALTGSFFDEITVFGNPTTGRRYAYDLYPSARPAHFSSSVKLIY